jgi:hypothetical protein
MSKKTVEESRVLQVDAVLARADFRATVEKMQRTRATMARYGAAVKPSCTSKASVSSDGARPSITDSTSRHRRYAA